MLKQILILSTLTLLGCTNSPGDKDEKDSSEKIKVSNNDSITALTNKYKAIRGWDTFDMYSYQLNNMFVERETPISFDGEISDIIMQDSIYILKIHFTGYPINKEFLALVKISKKEFTAFEKKLQLNPKKSSGCFIFKVNKVNSIIPTLNTDVETDGEDSYAYLDYDFDESLILFYGELLDYYFKINS